MRDAGWIVTAPGASTRERKKAQLDFIDEMFLETALARLEHIEHFTLEELAFFERGDQPVK